jgi:quercetin dioxygenase-like cupin family protein
MTSGERGRAAPVVVPASQSQSRRRQFMGVHFELLSIGPRTMVTKMLYQARHTVPAHRHHSEQSGYVLSGRYAFTAGGRHHMLGPGDSYSIPGGTEHSIEVVEPGEVIDVFSPPREDYR